jgi:hypothetical protein
MHGSTNIKFTSAVFERLGLRRKILQVLQIMKKSFSFINEKPVYTDCTSYLMENTFSEKVNRGATVKRINMVPSFKLSVKHRNNRIAQVLVCRDNLIFALFLTK